MIAILSLLSILLYAEGRNLTPEEYVRFGPEPKLPPIKPPTFPARYYAEGTLNLPYAEIEEPFKAWYDKDAGKSRIDFYDGMTKTVQRQDQGKYGQHYLIAPVTTDTVMNKKTCFQVNGTDDAVVTIQSVFPDLSDFTYSGMKNYKNTQVDVWTLVAERGQKINRYTAYFNKVNFQLVFYEMLGYDSLIGSHFDDYKVTYDLVSQSFSETVFDVPMRGIVCGDFPGPGADARVTANPMQMYIHPVKDEHVHKMFNDFITKYNKVEVNKSPEEYDHRRDNFKNNLRYIHSMNRKNLSYKLKVNHLAAHTPAEMKKMRGRTTTPLNARKTNGMLFRTNLTISDLPPERNWRLYGAVTPVKDQATCGSCWSFGATGTIEGAHFMKTGELVRLSQQNLMDCSWGYGNNACDGGEEFRSYEYIMKHGGLMSELEYGPYLGADAYCHFDPKKVAIKIKNYVNIPSGSVDDVKIAIFEHGPVAVGIDASHLSLSFYAHGVYYEPACGNKPEDLDHAVLAVGYGTLDGKDYWLVKNSWSTHWGNDGYVLMSSKDNNCGVATDATFVNLE